MNVNNAKKFWQWFDDNKGQLSKIEELPSGESEELLNEVLSKLHDFSKGLYFQIEPNACEFIITAEGNEKYFNDVEFLVNKAPILNDWKIIAFKPYNTDLKVTHYKDLHLGIDLLWFLPLENDQYPGKLGICVYIPLLDKNRLEDYTFAVWQILDSILGEQMSATYLNYLELEQLSYQNPDSVGLIELKDLRDYIIWFKNR